MACDHTQPICRRCTKRKQEDDCVYVISSPEQSRTKRRSVSPTRGLAALSPTPLVAGFSEPASARPVPPGIPEVQYKRPNPATNTKPGYLGFTSFTGLYEETQNSLSLVQGLGDSTPSSSDVRSSGVRQSGDDGGAAAFLRIREKCLTVLRNVPDEAQGRQLFRTFFSPMESWVYTVARRVLESFYREFGRFLGASPDNTTQLEKVAHKICVNTTRPFSDQETNLDVWINQLCGENLRWESVGLLFNCWDLSNHSKFFNHALVKDRLGRKGWDPLARECFNLCTDLCQEFSNGSSIMLHLGW